MTRKLDVRLLFALTGVALIWGTTYLGIRVAVETIPPWFVAAIRQTIAAIVLLVILLRKRELIWKDWPYLRRQMLLSLLMIVVANGMTTVAEQTIPSGLTSLLNALNPLIVFLACVAIGLQKPSLKGFVGVAIGFLGVVFIFREGLSELLDPNYKTGIMFLCFAISGWTIGTLYIKKNNHKSDHIFLDLFYQFAFSAAVQFVLAFLFSPDHNVAKWSLNSMLAVSYLAVFGSVVAFFCYHYALKKVAATEVSILTYFNTVIALFLGWLILDEIITKDILIATVLIIIGVFITNYKGKSFK
ncbi:DMT family transporter [Pedobacter africanus]|uniref:Permease of the drug/metabolite transporter (DMT) superfamily n=1 Tax=Pedobacter africanus TaxID=151894 RepID=A0A1W1ZGA3_9SPHI|nr:EamA family transporter [Pedobacter africanus]SMC47434.1 Permease of the drug/metabolite transporter (DMT) superfamily [Pedobacter africanus]